MGSECDRGPERIYTEDVGSPQAAPGPFRNTSGPWADEIAREWHKNGMEQACKHAPANINSAGTETETKRETDHA